MLTRGFQLAGSASVLWDFGHDLGRAARELGMLGRCEVEWATRGRILGRAGRERGEMRELLRLGLRRGMAKAQ